MLEGLESMVNFLRSSHAAVSILFLVACGSGSGSGATSIAKTPTKGDGPTGLPQIPGAPDTSVETAMPMLPRLPNVNASAVGDSVSITVEPVEGARDYRVYALPADEDIVAGADGNLTIKNAIYRCAGDRQTHGVVRDSAEKKQSESFRTLVEGEEVNGYTRTLPEATLGHVYVRAGEGRIPVYQMGDPKSGGENLCYHQRWDASRVKRYVTSQAERDQLLKERWRDDGIVFYLPAPDSTGTKPVYVGGGDNPIFYVDGPEQQKRGGTTVAFNVLADASLPDTVPLMRVFYENACGRSHDELMAGVPRFERARYQGDEHPMFDLHWSGITAETTLVVEALDVGCPAPGVLTSVSREAAREDGVDYPAFLTLSEAQAANETGEVFINGQHDKANKPRPIARSFVKISPGPKPQLDWYAGFGPDESMPDFMGTGFSEPCDDPTSPNCTGQHRQITDFADVSFFGATKNRSSLGVVMGELWITYADIGADVGGKIRITPPTKGKMAETSYLHVTMEVDAFTTARRYPQLIISDAAAPIQGRLPEANTVIVQPFPDEGTPNWPFLLQVQVCDHRQWEVNDQCPAEDPFRVRSSPELEKTDILAPVPEVGELTGIDRSTRIDAFVSTLRAYTFLDGKPYSCVNLPAKGVPSGDVTVTFGDVLYHSGVDEVFAYHTNNTKTVARRHFDNLGFKSGVEAPAWNEERMPCVNVKM
jgi:hypothetical protein